MSIWDEHRLTCRRRNCKRLEAEPGSVYCERHLDGDDNGEEL